MPKSILIPDELMIPAANATNEKYKRCADNWGEEECCFCRKQCGDEYAHIETDWIRRRAGYLRRQGQLVAVRPEMARGKLEQPTGKYKEYLQSDKWSRYRTNVLEHWGYRCALNADHTTDLEVHHRTYIRLYDERLDDCIPLCATCHKQIHRRMPSGNEIVNDDNRLWGDE